MAIDTETESDEIALSQQLQLSDTQVLALEKLDELGESPRESVTEKWHPNPQVRAYQMMYEGKIGGPGRGQGRKTKDRASGQVVEHIRDPKTIKKINTALTKALDDDNNRVRLEAIKIAMDLEDRHVRFQLDEEKHDVEIDKMERDDLIAEIIAIGSDPATQAAFDGFSNNGAIDSTAEDIGETQSVLEEDWEDETGEAEEATAIADAEVVTSDDTEAEGAEGAEDPEVDVGSGDNGGGPKIRRRGPATRARKANANAVLKTAKRRAANRRRTS